MEAFQKRESRSQAAVGVFLLCYPRDTWNLASAPRKLESEDTEEKHTNKLTADPIYGSFRHSLQS